MATSGRVEKIYSLKTIGYSDIIKELNNVEKSFAAIKKTKQDINNQKAKIDDPAELQRLNALLDEQKIKTAELLIEKQKLTNEAKAAQNVRQAEINQQKASIAGNKAEVDSVGQRRIAISELNKAIVNRTIGAPINFRNELLTYDQAITKLQQLKKEEQDFQRQFARDRLLVGEYTSGIVAAFKNLGLGDLVSGQITKAQEQLSLLNTDFDRLQKELLETRAAGQSTDTIEKQMIENRNQVISLDTQLARLRTDLRGVGDVGNQINTSLSNGFKSLKGQLGSFALQFIGIQALVNKLQSGFADAKLSSDLTTDLQIQLGQTAAEADNLNDALKRLNTRTTLTGLQQIADTALKAGVAKENIADVTAAIDKAKVAFGKDFGSVEEGTETFAKLINIFFTDGQITGDRILKIGNAIRSLANETVASVPFLTDFSGRMAGVKQISNISLPDILGLGAGFEEFKQSAEVAATTLVKLIPKLGKDVEKFAQIAGLTNEQFKKLLTENPAEALLKVSEGLVKGKGDVEEFAKSLADAGLDAGRVTTIVATLGGKADIFRDRIARAGVTIQDTGAITDAFNKKNTNLAAGMDKLNKKFSDFFASKSFQQGLSAILSIFLALLKILPIVVVGVALYAAETLRAYIVTQLTTKGTILYNLALLTLPARLAAARIALYAYYGAIALFTGGLTKATAVTTIFSSVLKAFPLGAILTVVGLLAGAFVAFGRSITGSTKALSETAQRQLALANVTREASEQIAKEVGVLDKLFKAATTMKDGYTAMINSRKDLIKQFPEFFGNLQAETASVKELTDGYNRAAVAIRAKAYANASAKLAADAQAQVDQVTATELILQAGFDTRKKGIIEISKLTEEQTDLLSKNFSAQERILARAAGGVKIREADFQAVKASLEKEKELRVGNAEVYDKLADRYNKKVKEQIEGTSVAAGAKGPASRTIDAIQSDLKDANEAFQKTVIGSKEFIELKAKIANLQKELEAADPKTRPGLDRGSRLTGDQKDAFKDIDAIRDTQLDNAKELNIEQRRLRDLSLDDEVDYLNKVLSINQSAINTKLSIIKGSNAEERRLIASLKLDRITQEQETNNKIFELNQEALKNQLDEEIKNIQERDRLVQEDINVSPGGKAQSKLDADKAILQLQIKFNSDIDQLEKKLAQQSVKNAKAGSDAIRKIRQDIFKDEKAVTLSTLDNIDKSTEDAIVKIKLKYDKLKQDILKSNKSISDKENAITLLVKVETVEVEGAKQTGQNKKLEAAKVLLDAGLITLKQYEEIYDAATAGQQRLNKAIEEGKKAITSLQGLLGSKLGNLFGFAEGSDKAKVLAETISQSFNLARTAMDDFYSAEAANIERSKNIQLKRLDTEKEQRLARAQSKDEEIAIEKQFAAKQDAINRAAFEKNKKIQRAQAKINLAIQLSNLAVIAFSPNPLNIATLGTAGIILYAVQAAIALAGYALNIARINAATYARGGEVPTRGGEFGGRPHSRGGTPFVFKGRQFEAESREVAVINKKSSQDPKVRTITGSNKQILSMINEMQGGIRFAPGAKIKLFESGGYLGDSLQPPTFNSFNSSNNGASDKKMDELIEVHKQSIAETKALKEEMSRRIDRLKVEQVTRTVTDAQRKEVQQNKVGTL